MTRQPVITKRESVPRFVDRMAARHSELRDVVTFDVMRAMADRDHVGVRLVRLPATQKARTLAIGHRLFIRINRDISRAEQTAAGMHELCHIWRDGLRASPYYSDEVTGGESCQFADIFAWYVTSPARPFFDRSIHQLNLAF
jgi:hypothetical protein